MSNNWIFMHISWSVVYSFIVNFGSIALLFFFLEREYIRSSRYLNSFQDNTVCRLMCGWKAEKKELRVRFSNLVFFIFPRIIFIIILSYCFLDWIRIRIWFWVCDIGMIHLNPVSSIVDRMDSHFLIPLSVTTSIATTSASPPPPPEIHEIKCEKHKVSIQENIRNQLSLRVHSAYMS